jgi:hypothetical protein
MKPDATEQQVARFIARYTPEMAAAIAAWRAKLRERVRSLRLASSDDLDTPAVARLLDLALAPHAADFAAAPPLSTVIKAVAAKQRERQPARR